MLLTLTFSSVAAVLGMVMCQAKIIFTAPTRPLVRQQWMAISETVGLPQVRRAMVVYGSYCSCDVACMYGLAGVHLSKADMVPGHVSCLLSCLREEQLPLSLPFLRKVVHCSCSCCQEEVGFKG